MPVRDVFVETNWVVDLVAPAFSRNPGAQALLDRSRSGELKLHVAAISLSEAQKVLRAANPRADVDNIRAFVRDRRDRAKLDRASADTVFGVLSQYEQHLTQERLAVPTRIAALRHDSAVDVFALDEASLGRSIEIAAETSLQLQSFDLAILAAVLVTAVSSTDRATM